MPQPISGPAPAASIVGIQDSNAFSRYASTHLAHFSTHDLEWRSRRIRYFQTRIGPRLPRDRGARILDLACGGGECIVALRELGYRDVRGIDISEEQVEIARANGVEGVERADALPFLSTNLTAFDAIVASHIVEHMPPDACVALLRASAAALREGGRLVVLTPNAGSPLGLPNTFGDLTHVLHFTATSLAQAAALADLEVVHVGGVSPDASGGGVKYVVWRLVRPFLAAALGSDSRYGAVVEPELVGVFRPTG
ncbi:MAG: class I SAM-dependent methyltransferase [Chloroflexota bacterium]|nr:class I SAM-dependent methyltransferase [Chloroflexota bacterium]